VCNTAQSSKSAQYGNTAQSRQKCAIRHRVGKSVQYGTVGKSVQYGTVGKSVQYGTVGKSVQYGTVGKSVACGAVGEVRWQEQQQVRTDEAVLLTGN